MLSIHHHHTTTTAMIKRKTEGGVLGAVASLKNWPEVFAAPAQCYEHYNHPRWPAPRPFEVPQPADK